MERIEKLAQTVRLTRQQLYDLIWADPITQVAKRFNISDVGLAKICRKKNIPRPPLGYWAKLRANKQVTQRPLPARGAGMSDEVLIGAKRWQDGYHLPDDELLKMELTRPVFNADIETVAAPITNAIGKVTATRDLSRAQTAVSSILTKDDERRQRAKEAKYVSIWDQPIFDEPIELRRLRLLSGLAKALGKCGIQMSIGGKEARELSIIVNDTRVSFALDATTQKHAYGRDALIQSRGSSKALRLSIEGSWSKKAPLAVWEDQKGCKIENQLKEVAFALVRAGEEMHRRHVNSHYKWLVERKAQIIEERIRKKREARQKEEERLLNLEKARVAKLLNDAGDLQKADTIRRFVADVRERLELGTANYDDSRVSKWSEWALRQADTLDPLRSGRFLEEGLNGQA